MSNLLLTTVIPIATCAISIVIFNNPVFSGYEKSVIATVKPIATCAIRIVIYNNPVFSWI